MEGEKLERFFYRITYIKYVNRALTCQLFRVTKFCPAMRQRRYRLAKIVIFQSCV